MMILDALLIQLACMAAFAAVDGRGFALWSMIALIIGALVWAGCLTFGRLWNRSYHRTVTHHVLGAMAALLATLTCLSFVSLRYLSPAARVTIAAWNLGVRADSALWRQAFGEAYAGVRTRGLEDFTAYPVTRREIPTKAKESQAIVATIYTRAALTSFETRHPFLGRLLGSSTRTPAAAVTRDMDTYFAARGSSQYPLERAIKLSADLLEQDLASRSPRLVVLSRAIVAVTFVVVLMFILSAIGISAARGVQVHA